MHYSAIAKLSQPLPIFFDPSVLRGFGNGSSLVPMHALSYWLDLRIFGVSARAAHLHSVFSTALTALLLFRVLFRFAGERWMAVCAAALWVTLPAAIGVESYLGPRHYLEGLAWSLAACLALHRLGLKEPGHRGLGVACLVLLFTAAAMLSKELYVATLPPLVAVLAMARGRRVLAATTLGLWPAYALYRVLLLGIEFGYPVPRLPVHEYVRYLGVLPFTFAAGKAGYVYLAALGSGCAVLLLARRPGAGKAILLFLALAVAGLAATYPTAAAVLLTYDTPGTWYRAVFLFDTTVLVMGVYLLARFATKPLQAIGVCFLVAILLPGVLATRAYWDRRFIQAETEGRFYLANPDKLVYSEEDASWYLPGLDRLYGVVRPHAVNKSILDGASVKEALAVFPTIWRYRDGSWQKDDALYAELRERQHD